MSKTTPISKGLFFLLLFGWMSGAGSLLWGSDYIVFHHVYVPKANDLCRKNEMTFSHLLRSRYKPIIISCNRKKEGAVSEQAIVPVQLKRGLLVESVILDTIIRIIITITLALLSFFLPSFIAYKIISRR
jgi:hypothetical protein